MVIKDCDLLKNIFCTHRVKKLQIKNHTKKSLQKKSYFNRLFWLHT